MRTPPTTVLRPSANATRGHVARCIETAAGSRAIHAGRGVQEVPNTRPDGMVRLSTGYTQVCVRRHNREGPPEP